MSPLRVLIADDNAADRLILKAMLEKEGHDVFAACDGIEAVTLFRDVAPDIVLLDALMPNMDGKDAAQRIKAESREQLVPIIFLTSLQEPEALAELIEVGGDDFLIKPYNRLLLKAKVSAFVRLKHLYQTIRNQRDEIQYHTNRLIHEQEVARKIFDNIAHPGCLNDANIRYNLKPKSIFNGDILVASRTPSGGLHILLGDFTGHGLPAAIGAMPLSDIFYSMTLKGYGMAEILAEINRKLLGSLPVDVFCCVVAADINPREELLRVWNCGMPTAYALRVGMGVMARFESRHLPLGIQPLRNLEAVGASIRIQPGDRLFMASDGVTEASNMAGEFFGEERLLALIDAHKDSGSVFEPLLQALVAFEADRALVDDVSLVEVTNHFEMMLESGAPRLSLIADTHVADWRIEYELRAQTLARWDPLPFILHILMETTGLTPKRSQIYTILSELYCNALDHGVLGLDSQLKQTPEGFSEYFSLREQKLATLDSGFVRFVLEQRPRANGGTLEITIEDSGAGFDWERYVSALKPTAFSGRGLTLLKSLSSEFHLEGKGNQARAVIHWTFPDRQ